MQHRQRLLETRSAYRSLCALTLAILALAAFTSRAASALRLQHATNDYRPTTAIPISDA